MTRLTAIGLSAVLGVAPVLAQVDGATGAGPSKGSACILCHEQIDAGSGDPLRSWDNDVHARAGLGCEGCHGGDSSPRLADDAEASMAPERGFKGAPDRFEVAAFCGTCHSDAQFMKQFNPQARVDQLAEYLTSVHGLRNAAGDPVPATCIDCHGVHGILPVSSPEAPVHAARVPETCAACHADPSIMEPYGIPTNQHEEYLRSAHAAALLERGDTAAPACNDCHGNHGAAPPGVTSVANVCGQCHGREAQLFRASFKKELFDEMETPECTACHANHRTVHPTSELFHSGSAPAVTAGEVTGVDPFSASLGRLEPGSAVELTWAVALEPHLDRASPELEHRVAISAEGVPALMIDATVRPGTDLGGPRRVGSPHFDTELTVDSPSGTPLKPGDSVRYRLKLAALQAPLSSVVVEDRPASGILSIRGSSCLACHLPGDECDQATERIYEAVSIANRELREAGEALHRAELAGMDVSDTVFELESKGVTAVVEARALIHSFDPDRLVERSEEGREVARSALQAARAALAELQYRRKGLAVSLVLVGFVLLGLYLKIRQVGPGS